MFPRQWQLDPPPVVAACQPKPGQDAADMAMFPLRNPASTSSQMSARGQHRGRAAGVAWSLLDRYGPCAGMLPGPRRQR